jgi:dihydroorotase-like cyclic amidohydrolase
MTDNNTTTFTVSQAFRLYESAKSNTALAQAALDKAKSAEYDSLLLVAKAAGGKTFVSDGQIYQIRERKRKDKTNLVFLTKLKRQPKEWLAEAREKMLEEALESADDEAALPDEQVDMAAEEAAKKTEESLADFEQQRRSIDEQVQAQLATYDEQEANKPVRLTNSSTADSSQFFSGSETVTTPDGQEVEVMD